MTYIPRSDFLAVMTARGFLQDCTDLEGLDKTLMAGAVPGYIGFDCTAPSLHVGHLTGIMMLHWLEATGHRPIVLMGGGTTRIGDPSGKDEARQLLSDEQIASNMAAIRGVFANYLSFEDAGGSALMLDNAAWLSGLRYIPFLRDFGRHFTVNRMLSFDSVRTRLDREQPLTFLEFNYMLLQAYDFLELERRHGCLLQMGGSDQWGNIVNGTDLIRRVDGREAFGLTAPLLTTPDGRKMGKTAGGAVWLNADMLSPYEFSQYWRNADDAMVGTLLRRFTRLPLDEIARLEALEGAELNEAKKVLANEATAMAHGREAAEAAEATARELFGGSRIAAPTQRGDSEVPPGGAQNFSPFAERGNLPTLTLTPADLGENGISAAQLFVRAGLAGSGKEAKRLIAEGGARIDDAPVASPGEMLGPERFERPVKLSAGKKRHALARLAE
ncbi:MAG TPA: tyrosine--tRNA ligase [Thermohalobaculum sp.]|nr:tyrosine--tRNA ligase [Thermohalobaculum sp.]